MTSVTSLSSASISSAIATDQKRLQKPITNLQNEAAADQAQISAWGAIQGSISSLSAALSNIADVGTTNTRVATSTAASTVSATAASSAATGTYSLTGITLAKTQALYSAVKTSAATNVGAGGSGSLVFTLKSGTTETVKISAADQTLTGIAAAINTAAGPVQASVIGTSSGARLVLQSASSGSSNAFSFTGAGGLAALNYSSSTAGGSFTSAQAAKNAALSINGVPVTSTSNTLSSAVSGLTLSLKASGAAAVTVASSAATISDNLSAVFTTLSAATAAIAKQTKYVAPPASGAASASAAKSGPLLGNFTATDISNNLLSAVSGAAASGLSATSIGISVSTSGKVTFDSTKFSSAYATNAKAVTALVSKVYASLHSATAAAIGSGSSTTATSVQNTGEIGAQTLSLQGVISSLTAQENQIAKQDTAALDILVKQYTTAESNSTNAQITQAYLDIFNTNSTSSG